MDDDDAADDDDAVDDDDAADDDDSAPGSDPCADYAWLDDVFDCEGDLVGLFDCSPVSPGEFGPGTCDLECAQVDGSMSLSVVPLPGGSTFELSPPSSFSFLAPPTTCTVGG